MSVIRLIRHGQASFGLKDYDELSKTGIRQAQLLGESLKDRVGDIDLVVSGGMRRHLQTAEYALQAMGLDLQPQVDERWNEYDHQELILRHKPAYKSKTIMAADLTRRGDPRRAFQLMFDDALERWVTGENDADYAEAWHAFIDRANAGLSALAEETSEANNVLVFTSGGPVSAVTARLLGLGPEGWIKLNRVCANASETKVVAGRSGVSLVSYNGHAHFDAHRELLTYR